MGLCCQVPGEPRKYSTLRGEAVTINRQGLFWFEAVNSAALMQGNNNVTLVEISAMGTNMPLRGVKVGSGFLHPYLMLTFINLTLAVIRLRSIDSKFAAAGR